jgi:hypothetical protein
MDIHEFVTEHYEDIALGNVLSVSSVHYPRFPGVRIVKELIK